MSQEFHELAMMAASIWAECHVEGFGNNPDDFGSEVASVYETAIEYLESDEIPDDVTEAAQDMAGKVLSQLANKQIKPD
jgi:hypothetical protein